MSINIAILHGCCQTPEMIKGLMKDYIKKIEKQCKEKTLEVNFFFPSGQFEHLDKGKMWYQTTLELDRIGSDDIPESDIISTLEYIECFIKTNKINILIGFSQGGNVVSTYLRLKNEDRHIKTAAIISGYDFPRYLKCHFNNINLIIVYSKEDNVVDYKLSPVSVFDTLDMVHEKGHTIFTRGSFVTSFVNQLLL